jgi:hypothetical protein
MTDLVDNMAAEPVSSMGFLTMLAGRWHGGAATQVATTVSAAMTTPRQRKRASQATIG